MAINQNIGRNIESNLPTVGGGAVGVAAPAALREFADLQDGQPFSLVGDPSSAVGRLTRPSVAYGLGMGALSGLLYLGGIGPDTLEEFYLAHSLTALPAGAVSAALPKEASGASGAAARQRAMRETSTSQSGPSRNGQGEFSPSGGVSAETRPAN